MRYLTKYVLCIKVSAENNEKDKNMTQQEANNKLYNAIMNCSIHGVKNAINNGADLNAIYDYGKTPLMLCCPERCFYDPSTDKQDQILAKIAELLVAQKGIRLNVQNNYGSTALIMAVRSDHTKTAKLLIKQKGILLNVRNNNGDTALMIASREGHAFHTDIVDLLVAQKGIRLNVQNNDGDTALIMAVRAGHIKIVESLITQKGIRLNVQNNNGDTAVIIAARNRRYDIVRSLMEHGADINKQNYLGESAKMIIQQEIAVEKRKVAHTARKYKTLVALNNIENGKRI